MKKRTFKIAKLWLNSFEDFGKIFFIKKRKLTVIFVIVNDWNTSAKRTRLQG